MKEKQHISRHYSQRTSYARPAFYSLIIGLFVCTAAFCCRAPEKAFASIIRTTKMPFFEYTNTGSAVLIDKKQGLFLTNAHVVGRRPLEDLRIQHAGGDFVTTTVIAADPINDLAILRCDPSKIGGMVEAPISQRPTVPGMWVKSVSNDSATKQGKVSVKEGVFASETIYAQCVGGFVSANILFIYAAPGCSGSPVFNEFNEIQGLTCGMNQYNAKVISIYRIRSFVDSVRRHLRDPKQAINSRILQGYGIYGIPTFDVRNIVKNHPALQKESKCLLVYRVFPKEGVERALRVGDVILSVNGKKMHGNEQTFDEEVVNSSALDCEVLRHGSIVRVHLDITEYDPNAGEMYTYGPMVFRAATKIYAAELPEETILDDTYYFARAILAASGQRVANMADLAQVFERRGWKPLCLGVSAQNNIGKQVRLLDIDLPQVYHTARHYTYKGEFSQERSVNLEGAA